MRPQSRPRAAFGAFAVICLCAASSRAQATAPAEDYQPVSFYIATSYLFPSGVSGTDASITRATVLGDAALRLPPVSDNLSFGLFVAGGSISYDFDGDARLGNPANVDPWQRVNLASMGATAFYEDGKWSGFGALNLSWAAEDGAAFADGFTGGGFGGVSYAFSPDLTLGVGLIVQSRLDDDLVIVPIPTLRWTPDFDAQRRWTIEIGSQNAGPVLGAGGTVSFRTSDQLTLSAGITGFGIGGEFRLRDDGPIRGGVGRDFSTPAVLSATWTPRPGIRVNGFAGANVFGNLQVLDSNGDKIGDRDLETGFIAGVSATLAF